MILEAWVVRPRCMRGIRKVTFQLSCHLLGFHIHLVSYRLGSSVPALRSSLWFSVQGHGPSSVGLAMSEGIWPPQWGRGAAGIEWWRSGMLPSTLQDPSPNRECPVQCQQLRNHVMTFDCIIFLRKAFLVVFLSE